MRNVRKTKIDKMDKKLMSPQEMEELPKKERPEYRNGNGDLE